MLSGTQKNCMPEIFFEHKKNNTCLWKKKAKNIESANQRSVLIAYMGGSFRINPEFSILRLTFQRKSASKC